MQAGITILIGLFIGMSAGMFGIGGALVATPMLKLWLGLSAKLALATPLPAAIPAALSGSVAYSRAGLVRYDVVWRVLATALPMNVLGAYLTRWAADSLLMIATGCVLAYTAWAFIRRGWKRGDAGAEGVVEGAAEQRFGLLAHAAGALAGFTSGFLAIGGGIVMVPAFVRILRMPMKSALATSLVCVAALAIPGVVVHGLLEHIDWDVALILCAAVVPMSYLGARLATRLRNTTLERIYGVVMLAFALYFVVMNL